MKESTKLIVCCGFTPCVQRILEFDRLEKGQVNRTGRVTIGIGGKGGNTARMVRQLGGRPQLLGFAGGATGRLLEQLLHEEEVDFRPVSTRGETRICQTLVEQGDPEPTELVEEMPAITPDEWMAMCELLDSLLLNGAIVPISGKLPAGAPLDAYAQVARRVRKKDGRVLLDAPGEPLLQALSHAPALVKINDEELLQTVSGKELMPACNELLERGAQAVLITRGCRSALLVDTACSIELIPPTIKAVNPVGSGDAVTAGMAVALQAGKSLLEAARFGMACGAANALNLRSGWLKMEDVERLQDQVKIVQQPD